MSSRERWDALVRGDELDRVPCLQFILGHTAVVSGKPIAKIYDDAAVEHRLPARRHGDVRLRRPRPARLGQRRRRRVRGRDRVPVPQVHRRPHDEEEPGAERGGRLEPPRAGRHRRGRHDPGGARVLAAAARARHALHGAGGLAAHLGGVDLRRGAAHGLAHQEAGSGPPRAARDHGFHPARRRELWVEGVRRRERSWPSTCASRPTSCIRPSSSRPSPSPTSRRSTTGSPSMGVAIFLSHICGEQNRNLPYWSQLSYGKRGMVSVGPRDRPDQRRAQAFPEQRDHGQRRPGDHPGRHARGGA